MSFVLTNNIRRDVPVYMPSGKNAFKQHIIQVEYKLLDDEAWNGYLNDIENLDRTEQYERQKEVLEDILLHVHSEILNDEGDVLDEEDARYAVLRHPMTNKALIASYVELMNKNNFRRSSSKKSD